MAAAVGLKIVPALGGYQSRAFLYWTDGGYVLSNKINLGGLSLKASVDPLK